MMMMTATESAASSMSQSIDHSNYAASRPSMTTSYDHRHHHPWHNKPSYAIFHPPATHFPTHSTGASQSSLDMTTTNKPYYPSFVDSLPNLNNTNPNFYRRHTESTLSTTNALYSSSSTAPFNYSPHPSGLYFGWNNHGSPLMRTHSASFQDYSTPTVYSPYTSMNSSSSQPIVTDKTAASARIPPLGSSHPYPSFLNMMAPIHYHLPVSSSSSATATYSASAHSSKRSIPSKVTKRPRLTAHLRSEILKLKAQKPTVFVWEIQQNLLQNGVCCPQTLPSPTVIQRVLNESSKPSLPVREDVKMDIKPSLLTKPSPVTICLSPSPSPGGLSDGESVSECSICLASYRSGQEVSILACAHEYHSSCIGEWMRKNRSCPMCRKDIHNQPQFVTLLI